MSFAELFLISLGLSMDCFAVTLSFGAQGRLQWKDILKMAFFFGLFQGMMPVAGWIAGNSVKSYLSAVDHWVAFGILAVIGLRMIYESFSREEDKKQVDIRDWKILLSLSVATSIDALITGIGFGFIRVNILLAAITIACITFINSITGAVVGIRAIHISPRWAEISGGAVLILIGLKIVAEHLGLI